MKALEERGIGRPSTYASIMGDDPRPRATSSRRAPRSCRRSSPSPSTQLLERHFDQLVDYDFTARMEDDLDRIAAGDEERVDWLTRFYFGDGDPGLHALVTDHLDEIDAREVNSIAIPGSRHRRPGRAVRPVPRARRAAREPARRTSRPTS